MNWDHLHSFLAVVQHGSVVAAARAIGVAHTTIARRISALESELGVRLFDRRADGYWLTHEGERVAVHVREIGDRVTALERDTAGRDTRVEGPVRVSVSESLLLDWALPHLERFAHEWRGIQLELITSDSLSNLHRREADVALRATNDPPETLVGRKLAVIAVATYRARGTRPDRWVGWVDRSGEHAWKEGPLADMPVHHRSNSPVVYRELAARGFGLAKIPCYVGDADPRLERVPPGEPEFDRAVWLLTHADLRSAKRIRLLLDFLGESMAAERDRIEVGATRWRER
ncbi:MAG: LysR family transcriptional regulator [Myxococcota bacterium]